MTQFQKIIQAHRKMACGIVFGFMIFFSCFSFPFINFTRDFPAYIKISTIAVTFGAFIYMGIAEANVFTESTFGKIFFMNLVLVVAGMGARYLLEFGEVSNTYNFTVLNSMVHIFVTVVLTTITWYYLYSNKICKEKG